MTLPQFGALCFGVLVGWITYRTLRHAETSGISDLASVIGAVGGAAVVNLFPGADQFAYYSIGLAAGFFLYILVFLLLREESPTRVWMSGAEPRDARGAAPGSRAPADLEEIASR